MSDMTLTLTDRLCIEMTFMLTSSIAMALPVPPSDVVTGFPIFIFYTLCAALAGTLIYVVGSIICSFAFYVKERIHASGRPPVAGSFFHLFLCLDTFFDIQTAVARRHKTFRFILPIFHSEIYTADPANIEHILKSNFYKYPKGDFNHNTVRDLFGDGIFAVDGDKWRHQRKLASFEFSTRVLREFSGRVFRDNAGKVAGKISDATDTAKPVVIQDILMNSTMDSMFKIGFGVELDILASSDGLATRFRKAFDDANALVFHRYLDLFWPIKRRLNIGSEAELKRNIKVIDKFVFQLIQLKREQMMKGEEQKTKGDILSRFILASEEEADKKLSDRYLRDIILNFLIAGKDTTATTLSWFFYLLCKHPLVQEKIAAEVKEVMKMEGCSIAEFATGLSDEAIDKMHYLHAALTETLRLYPAVPVDGKCADEDDVLPDGFKVNKGDGVSYLIYAMGRMTYLWGEDAEDFHPERWLQNGIFKPESPFKFVSFNAGPRICLGKEFAYLQMKIFAATILHFFKLKLKDEAKIARYRTMFTLQMAEDLPLLAFPRGV